MSPRLTVRAAPVGVTLKVTFTQAEVSFSSVTLTLLGFATGLPSPVTVTLPVCCV